MVLTKYAFAGSKPLENSFHQNLHYAIFPFFNSYYHNIRINSTITKLTTDTIEASVVIVNQRTSPLIFSNGLNGETTTLVSSIEKGKTIIKTDILEPLFLKLPPYDSITRLVKIPVTDLPQGSYLLHFGIRNGVLPDAILSREQTFTK
jgi:hypothetical protein